MSRAQKILEMAFGSGVKTTYNTQMKKYHGKRFAKHGMKVQKYMKKLEK
jgi:hypothetical protein